MKVNFIRKPTPSEIYPQDNFIIEKIVKLPEEEFYDLLKEPLKDREYIRDNKDKMYIDKDDYYHCIYIVADDYDYGILIESSGSNYPYNTAYIPKIIIKNSLYLSKEKLE